MRTPTPAEIAYCAGIFDGEGTICITRKRPRTSTQHSPSFGLLVSVSNTNKLLIEFLHQLWGGYFLVSTKPKGNKRAAYRWTLTGHHTIPFLRAVLPLVIIKRKEIELGLEFQSTKRYTCKRLSQETIDGRQAMMNRMSALKGRVHKPHLLGLTAGTPGPKLTE